MFVKKQEIYTMQDIRVSHTQATRYARRKKKLQIIEPSQRSFYYKL